MTLSGNAVLFSAVKETERLLKSSSALHSTQFRAAQSSAIAHRKSLSADKHQTQYQLFLYLCRFNGMKLSTLFDEHIMFGISEPTLHKHCFSAKRNEEKYDVARLITLAEVKTDE